jgi:hypothetical protein
MNASEVIEFVGADDREQRLSDDIEQSVIVSNEELSIDVGTSIVHLCFLV